MKKPLEQQSNESVQATESMSQPEPAMYRDNQATNLHYNRRQLLKIGVGIAALTSLNQSQADLSIGGQIISQTPMIPSSNNASINNDTTDNTSAGGGFGENSWTEPATPVFDFPTIQAECHAMQGRGVKLHLLAPSGFGSDEQRNLLAIHRLTQAGFYVDNPEVINRRYLRFAGDDAARLNDLTPYLTQPVSELPKVLLGVRGGYGSMRLLNKLTPSQWRTLANKFKQRGTLLMGFSDFTGLQLALLAQGGLPYVSGTMLGSDFGKPVVNQATINSFIALCSQNQLTINVLEAQHYISPRTNSLTGTLWGGNLSVLAALVGTPYLPNIDRGILFLEDTGEQPYRIERMLQTLLLSGVLAKQQAIILGKFNFSGISNAYNGDYTFDTVVRYLADSTGLPIYTDFPFGHVAQRINFPLGVPVTLTTTDNGYRASFNQFYNLNNDPKAAALNLTQLLS